MNQDYYPNETDDKCPICLEAYTPKKQRDGVRNSEYKLSVPTTAVCLAGWTYIIIKIKRNGVLYVRKTLLTGWRTTIQITWAITLNQNKKLYI